MPLIQGGPQPAELIFTDSNRLGKFLLQVEETRVDIGLTGVERRDIRWRSATIDEAKMVLESYNGLRNLTTTAIFTVSTDAKPWASGQSEKIGSEPKNPAIGQNMADATLVP